MEIKTGDLPRALLTFAVRRMPADRRDWGAGMLAELALLQNRSTRWRFALGCARVALFPPRQEGLIIYMIKNILTNPRAAALIGLVLALPIPLILLISSYDIEPLNSFLKSLFTEAGGPVNNTFALIFLLGGLMLLPVAAVITLRPVVSALRAGAGVTANPVNLLLGASILIFIVSIAITFIVDQYPCWIGVPNCD
jgi:uncharacterized membrane protein YidH (DUF202 family)